ncbi:MAG TPA: hypothetical protein VGS20_07115 [Candidatus Acidoferrales bacterium]|nr:hypothetical protein [Candidatus Acidoferrales bacterium]
MGRPVLRISIGVVAVATLAFLPFLVEACGPDLSPPTFTGYNEPDAPLDAYAGGQLGLIEPGYHHAFLYVAYRILAGKPLSRAQIAALPGAHGLAASLTVQPQTSPAQPPTNWIDVWIAQRKKVLGNSATGNFGFYTDWGVLRQTRENGVYLEYYNCLQDSFQNAALILGRRIAQFGAQSLYVKQWLNAQDQVFENCGGEGGYPPRQPVRSIPAVASPADPPSIHDDRAYQIAAAHFYAGEFDEAKAGFEAIAGDATSPYRRISAYLVARVLVRQATLTAGPGRLDARKLAEAERRLESILADENLAEIHPAAQRLLGFVRIRLYPRQRGQELQSALLSTQADPEFRQNLIDYLWLLDQPSQRPAQVAGSAPEAAAESGAPLEAGDMTDWIGTFQAGGPAAFQHALARWRKTSSLPWLIAAISKERGTDPAAEGLEAAASLVPAGSPGYITATFHRLRLLSEAGRRITARSGIESFLSSAPPDLAPAARNQFLALRMSLAGSLEDWLRYAVRQPVDLGGFSYGPPAGTPRQAMPPILDSDASDVLTEKLPLPLLAHAALSDELPSSAREQVALAAWTRAILLDDSGVAGSITPLLASLAPELRTSLAAYAAASGPERNFAAVILLLRFPGLRPFVPAGLPRWGLFHGPEPLAQIDSFRDNWWCAMGPVQGSAWQFNYYTMYAKLSSPLAEIYPGGMLPYPAFLGNRERTAATKQWAALQALPAAPDWMAMQAIAWAQAHPGDPGVPEALHLVVRATRYGCADADSPKYSRRAFTLLHSRYPHSPWTRKTPVWFR